MVLARIIWEDQELLSRTERVREQMRAKGKRLAFDCFNLKSGDSRAYCSKGYSLGQVSDGSIALINILRGVTPSACKGCQEYDSNS